jgi:hypothetical protein
MCPATGTALALYGAYKVGRWCWNKFFGSDESEAPIVQQQPVSNPPNPIVKVAQAIREEVVEACTPVIETVCETFEKATEFVKEVVEDVVEVIVEAPGKARKAFARTSAFVLVVMDSVRCLDVQTLLQAFLNGPVRTRAPTFA